MITDVSLVGGDVCSVSSNPIVEIGRACRASADIYDEGDTIAVSFGHFPNAEISDGSIAHMGISRHRHLAERLAAVGDETSAEAWPKRMKASPLAAAFSQPYLRHNSETDKVLWYLLRLWCMGMLSVAFVPVDSPAGPDGAREQHQGILDRSLSGMGASAHIDPSQRNDDHDGYMMLGASLPGMSSLCGHIGEPAHRDFLIKHVGTNAFREFYNEALVKELDNARQDAEISSAGYTPWWVAKEGWFWFRYPVQVGPWKGGGAPLEIGYCDPTRVLHHLLTYQCLVRWPRGYATLVVLQAASFGPNEQVDLSALLDIDEQGMPHAVSFATLRVAFGMIHRFTLADSKAQFDDRWLN